MKAAVIVYPGSNCDRDLAVAFRNAGAEVAMVWHKETALPAGTDVVGVPGGFSFGDYLRCGAIAARSPVTAAVVEHAKKGGHVIGICNGFQVLVETGLLPGALMRNAGLKFICRTVPLTVATRTASSPRDMRQGRRSGCPSRITTATTTPTPLCASCAARTAWPSATPSPSTARPTTSRASCRQNRRVLGLMPHPERAASRRHGGTDGAALFRSLVAAMADA
jgi:phosphoribosylformylglycinamidine synthase subunit PurQ / glutaminase